MPAQPVSPAPCQALRVCWFSYFATHKTRVQQANTDVYQHSEERLTPLGEQSGLPQQLCALASVQTSQWGPVGTAQLWDTERHIEAAAEHPTLLPTALPCAAQQPSGVKHYKSLCMDLQAAHVPKSAWWSGDESHQCCEPGVQHRAERPSFQCQHWGTWGAALFFPSPGPRTAHTSSQ